MVSLTPPPPAGEINIFKDFAVAERSPFDLEKLSNQFRARHSDWTIPEAYLALIMAATTADGQYHPTEHETFMNVVRRSRALSALPADALRAAEKNVQERARTRKAWLAEACETLPSDMRLSVFAHCVDVALSDGELLEVETRFLHELVQLMDIPPDKARRLMEALLVKAQY